MAGILIIDDEAAITGDLGAFLERNGAHRVRCAHSGAEGLEAFRRFQPELVLLDVRLPDMSGFDVLARMRDAKPVVIMITGHGDVPMAVEAMRGGAENFLTKPVELEHLASAAERALEKARLRRINRYLTARRSGSGALALLGSSPTMCDIADQVELLAASDRTALLLGESGTGKGRVAELIYARSPRAAGPFVQVNCAALAGEALDAELFGQECAGTDCAGAKASLVEVADGGTLFLDEIGELGSELQLKLLRVLQGGSFRRSGGTQEIPAEVRVIAATSRDLVNEVTAGRFSEDLYYRLSAMPIYLPPLRARSREDLLELVASAFSELRPQLPDAPSDIDDGALERLARHAWPGNIRELRNVLERAMIVARGAPRIMGAHLPADVRDADGAGGEGHLPRSLEEVERAHIERTLRAHNENRTHAAKELGISRATLIKKIKEYGFK